VFSNICKDRDCLVSGCWERRWLECNFYEDFLGESDMLEWERWMDMLDNFRLTEGEDKFIWVLGSYTTRSMYRRLTFREISNSRLMKLWKNERVATKKKFYVAGLSRWASNKVTFFKKN
jgi:hypothetical protein